MFKGRKKKFTFHTKKGLSADWLAVMNMAGDARICKSLLPPLHTLGEQLSLVSTVRPTVLQRVKLPVIARKAGRTQRLGKTQLAFLRAFLNVWQKSPSLHLSQVATQVVQGTWVNNRTQQTQTVAAQLRPAGQEGPRRQTQLSVILPLVSRENWLQKD